MVRKMDSGTPGLPWCGSSSSYQLSPMCDGNVGRGRAQEVS